FTHIVRPCISLYLPFLLFSTPRPPRPPLFPYTTLFRSHHEVHRQGQVVPAVRLDPRSGRRRRSELQPGRRHPRAQAGDRQGRLRDRKSTRLNSSHSQISYAVFCLKKKKKKQTQNNQIKK